jgi:hypothetical protein
MHHESICFQAVAPGSSGAAAAAATGDSLIVKNSKGAAHVIAMYGKNQTSGFQQITFPSGHDTTRGYRYNIPAGKIDNRLTMGVALDVQPQETITATIAGSSTAGQVETGILQMLYDDLPGVMMRSIGWDALVKNAEKQTTVSATLTGAAAGYTGEALINSQSDLLRANRDYAVLGMTTNLDCAGLYIKGPDSGYQRQMVPGSVDDSQILQEWFPLLARAYGEDLIPVFNSGNKNSIYLGFVQDQNNISPLVTLYLALLK